MAWLKDKKILIVLLGALLLLSAVLALVATYGQSTRFSRLDIGDKNIAVEIAATAAARHRGLSGRPSLCPDCGMLFVFPDQAERRFVMRKMNFPLDMIFIAEGRVVNIANNLPPEGDNPMAVYSSGQLADMVLEVNGGYAARAGIEVGAEARLNNR